MDTAPQHLHRSLSQTLIEIEHQILIVHREAEVMHTEPSLIRDERGNFLLTPLLVGKAQVLHALTLLEMRSDDGLA